MLELTRLMAENKEMKSRQSKYGTVINDVKDKNL